MLTAEEIKKISHLARIDLDDEGAKKFANSLQNIMKMIDTMQDIDTEDAEPLLSVANQTLPLRKDEVTEGNIAEILLANAPGKTAAFAKEINCFVVPKVVE